MTYTTEQEAFWAGSFGDDYIGRNKSSELLFTKVAMWSRILRSANSVMSVRELGCNVGLNLVALNKLRPELELSGYEINEKAVAEAKKSGVASIFHGSILDVLDEDPVDLTFTSGVLIHINPDHIDNVYRNLVSGSKRYVLVAEYYNPFPVTVNYRGCSDKLFKRDFAGDLIENYGLKLVDYGFVYKRDNWAPQDDVTWFLLEK